MTHTYPIPNTSAAIQAARDALDAIEPAVQQDIRDIVASLIEAGDIPAARRAVNEAAATASSASDADSIVVAQEQIRAAAAKPTPVPVAAPAAPRTYEAPDGAPDWLTAYDRTAVQPLYDTTKDHERRISKLETNGVGGVPTSAWQIGGIAALIILIIGMVIFMAFVGTNFTSALLWSAFVAFVVGCIATAIAAGRNNHQSN